MPDTLPSVTPTWGPTNPPPPGRNRRRKLLAVLIALTVLAGVGVGLLYWFAPPRAPRALPIFITVEPGVSGPVPWAAQDRAALLDAGLLGHAIDDAGANPNRDQIRLRFQALAKISSREPVVVYLAAPAAVDAAGAVYILPADPLGDHPRNRLPLADLLSAFKDCPARHKLLVLQLTPPPEDPLFASPSGELSNAVFRTLDAVPDESRLCFVACGPGETPLASHDLGRSVFSYYLEAGLRGSADGWSGERDGRVTVNELASFVRSRVSRWATANLRSSQTPILVGTAADFPLRSYSRSHLTEPYPTPPAPETANDPPPFAFPAWLKAGWEKHDRLISDGRAAAAPRALAVMRAALLNAERDLLAGRAAVDVQPILDRQLTAAESLAATLSAVPTPDPLPTLAAAFPGYVLPEPALLDELRAESTRADAAPAPPATPDKPAPFTLSPEFDAFKAKPYPTLALAVFLLLNEDSPTALQVRRYALLLSSREPVPKFAEVMLIQRLAALAEPGSPVAWSPHRAALALQTARNLEAAASRPELVLWARQELDEAYRLRVDAEAVLFAPAFAPTDEADRRLKRAADASLQLNAFATQLRSAMNAHDEADRWLTGAAAAVESGLVPLTVALGFAEATRQLADALESPTPSQAASLREKEAAVRNALTEFTRPFRSDAITRIRTRIESGETTTALLAELDAVLRMPFLPSVDRAALWDARAAVTRRLNAETVRTDAADDEAFRRDLSRPDAPDPRLALTPLPSDGERLSRQARWSAAVLAVGGMKADVDVPTNPPAISARLHRIWLEDVPANLVSPRLARVAPVLPATHFLDQPDRNPNTIVRKSNARDLWAWQSARFAYETRDPLDAVPSEGSFKYTSSAARACSVAAGPVAEPHLELDTVPAVLLKPDQLAATFNVKARLLGSAAPRNVTVRVLSPSAEWVQATGAATSLFDPIRGAILSFQVTVGDLPNAHPELRGVLIEAAIADGRTYHRRVAVGLDDLVNRLGIAIRPTAEGARPVRAVELRPNNDPQPYELRLLNPGKKPQTVVVRLPQYDRETDKVTIDGNGDVKLKFKPPPPPTVVPVPMTAPPPPPVDPFDLVKGNALEIVLLDAANTEKVLQRFSIPVQVLDPADYIEIEDVAFTPTIGSRPNRLELNMLPRKVPPGPPVTITATLPYERNPDVLRVQDANLSAPLPPAGRPLTLYAENTTFKKSTGANVLVTVAADRTERIFTFAGFLPPLGGTVRLAPLTYPMVRVRAKPPPLDGKEPPPVPKVEGPLPRREYVEPVYASGLKPLPLELEVDNAPDGSTVQIRLGSLRTDDGGRPVFVPDVVLPLSPEEPPIPAKDRTARVKFDAKGETLEFKGTLRDPAATLPVEVLVGERVIEARLLGRDGRPLTDLDGREVVGRTHVIFDGAKPTGIEFIRLEPRLPWGKTLIVRATSDLPVSGVKEVKFFLGLPVKDGPPQPMAAVIGVLFDAKANEWRAELPIEGLKGKQVVGVQFVSKAGQEKATSTEVELIDPVEFNKPLPGTIFGTVIDNDFKQVGLKVYLFDAAAKPVKETTTDGDGNYEFKEIPAATYFVYAYNIPTRRDKKVRVDLKPGAKEKADLELFLGGAR